jgi:hypothetical protein
MLVTTVKISKYNAERIFKTTSSLAQNILTSLIITTINDISYTVKT